MRYILIALLVCNLAYFAHKTVLNDGQKTVFSARDSVAGVESIYLLSENSRGSLRDRELELVVNNPMTTLGEESGSCDVIGPFVDIFLGQNAADRINAVKLMVEMKALDVMTGESDYRVMLPRSASLQGAFRKLRELKSQGIDSYVITQGADALSISLGVFSTKGAADALESKLLLDGYKVIVSGIPRLSRQLWMFPLDGENIEIDDLAWQALVENHPDIKKKQLQCLET
jgi:hypothetical protein